MLICLKWSASIRMSVSGAADRDRRRSSLRAIRSIARRLGRSVSGIGQCHFLEEHGLLLELAECDFKFPRPVDDALFEFHVELAEFVEQLFVAALHEQGPRRGRADDWSRSSPATA